MAKKSLTSKGKQPATTTTTLEEEDRWLPLLQSTKINPCSLVELKTTLDDTVKEFYSLQRHNFKVSHKHEDIRLSLGWTSVVIALGTTYYAYKLDDFQGTKNWVALGVTLYVVLNTILALYVTYFEKNIIWVGKRRTIASRITTELLEISSIASSSQTNSTQSSWIPFPLSLITSSTPTNRNDTTTSETGEKSYPIYTLTFYYTHSANANKSLLHRQTLTSFKHVGELFDREGKLARDLIEIWLKENLEKVLNRDGNELKESISR